MKTKYDMHAAIFHSEILSKFPEIIQGTSSKDFGPLSFIYNKDTNKIIIDRVKFLSYLCLDATHSILVGEENHTNNIIHITDEHRGHGLLDMTQQIPNADGMITALKNTHLIIYTADCMPISFYDPVKKVIGIAHSGWRGTIQGIGVKMIEKFQTLYGSDVRDIRIAIGPSIGGCCYDVVDPQELAFFDKKYGNVQKRGQRKYINLWGSIEKDMYGVGILKENFENNHICTCCHHDLYASHRGDKPNTTTNLTVISMCDASHKNVVKTL